VTSGYGTLGAVTDVDPSPRFQPTPPPRHHAGIRRTTVAGRATPHHRSERPSWRRCRSRLVEPGHLFVALSGERTDGHAYLSDAMPGASAVVARPSPSRHARGRLAMVADPLTTRRRGDGLAPSVRPRRRHAGSIARLRKGRLLPLPLAAFRTLRNEEQQNNEGRAASDGPASRAGHGGASRDGMYVGGEIADLARIARPASAW
jgi:UDP-N-acetylmuramoyl-tripeptide--D-alanyl-D-alanine ligase